MFLNKLKSQFEAHRNEINAKQMEAYMKHLFPFFGIKSPVRKTILKNTINTHKEELVSDVEVLTKALYKEPEREYHYCAMEIYARFKKRRYVKIDEPFIRELITSHSHWDTVDFIAKHIFGQFLLECPQLKHDTIKKYTNSQNMWLNRTAILFQLGHKAQTDFELLKTLCIQHKSSNEFYIRKAIGWALREYAKIDMRAVETFVNCTDLKPLSKREALKHLT